MVRNCRSSGEIHVSFVGNRWKRFIEEELSQKLEGIVSSAQRIDEVAGLYLKLFSCQKKKKEIVFRPDSGL